jgi:hypothetical protein
MEVRNSVQDLLEATFDFARRHRRPLDRGVEVTTGAEFHDLEPLLILLDKIYGLNDVDVI